MKYHLFERKRDGGIISQVLKDDGTITDNPKEVASLLRQTIVDIQVEEKWGWLKEEPFPKLPRLSLDQTVELMKLLSTNKAIAHDALSDILFKCNHGNETPSNIELAAKKLRNLWRTNLDELEDFGPSWDARLVPLNKIFPETPNRKQMRPIVIQSPLIKLLEARFLTKLQTYLTQKLDRSQTGFVKGMGTQVNLWRAIKRINIRTADNKPVFGLFIDFSNAYNSVPHTLLFKKLQTKNIFEENELQFLKCLYARYRIKIGNTSFRTNKGVAQGSILSPALFNIFLEDLSEELRRNADINLEDLLLYADDILVLTTSPTQLSKAIQIIEDWCQRNGMELNKNKSGIVIFTNKMMKDVPLMKRMQKSSKNKTHWAPAIETFKGIPVAMTYKYLGTILHSTLSINPQLTHIKKKSNHMFVKLYPYLQNASAEGRRDMWQTLTAPLFNATLSLLDAEPTKSGTKNVLLIWRKTFKQFMMIPKRTPTILINEMINKDLLYLSKINAINNIIKWQSRRSSLEGVRHITIPRFPNPLKGIPNLWCQLLKTQYQACKECLKRKTFRLASSWHRLYAHNQRSKPALKIWNNEILLENDEKIKRKQKLKKFKQILAIHLNMIPESKSITGDASL